MAFLARGSASLLAAFLLFPLIFVVWHGPDRDFGFVGGVVMMMFLQFISPYGLWKIPLAAGAVIGIVWQALAARKPVPLDS